MKNIQKLMLCLGFLAFTTASAFAQLLPGDKTVDLSVHANVQATASVQNVADIEFDTILPNGTATIVPNGTNTGVTGGATYGVATITPPSILGLINDFSISFPATVTLTGDGGTLTYEPDVFKSDQADDAANSTQVTSGALLDLSNLTLGAGDPIYLYVGGKIGPLSNQASGDYSGSLTITVSSL